MFSLLFTALPANRETLIAELWEAGTTGITEDDDSLRAFFSDADQEATITRFAHLNPSQHQEPEYDWTDHFQRQWQPFAVGRSWWLAPPWVHEQPPEARTRLTVHPGMACGTGWHAATQLCLIALESYAKPGSHIIDIGTGSGILAEAAFLLNAAFVTGCDIDESAVTIARANIPAPIALFAGSLRSVRPSAFDLAVANLNCETFRTLAPEIRRVLKPGGLLIASGYRECDFPFIGWNDAALLGRYEQDGWRCEVLALPSP